MATHSHASYGLGHVRTARYWLDLRPGDLHWNMSDTGWAKAAWSSFYAPWSMGAAVFVDADSGPFDPERTLGLLCDYPVTSFCAAPTAYRLLVQQPLEEWCLRERACGSLRHCASAGEPLNPEVIETWRAHTGLTVRDGYGQTETCLLVGSFPCIEARPGSMGKPAPGYDVQILDEDAAVCADDQEGDIAVRVAGGEGVTAGRPVGLFDGYLGDRERTAAAYKRDAAGGEWYLTGDRARRDADGYLWFVGRADDVIISAGYRVGPFEVESALQEHGDVVESAVVAGPDPVRGSVVKAYVVLAPAAAQRVFAGAPDDAWAASAASAAHQEMARELQEHVKQTTAPYKYPRRIEFVRSLPKNAAGKTLRVELRQLSASD
eukprot:g8269.t1